MKLAIGNDHVGYSLKLHLMDYLKQKGHELVDFGCDSEESCDYPIFAKKVAEAVVGGQYDLGILICGTGVGISISANKVRGIRAVVCSEPYSARLARQHNDANILAFGARVIGPAIAEMIVDEFLNARYEGGRHQRRVDLISQIENER